MQTSLFDHVQIAINRLKEFEQFAIANNPNGYYVAYSGGKDSTVIAHLCLMAGVKFELVNNHTTIDPPELVYFIREQFKWFRQKGINCRVEMPEQTMWELIIKKKFPPLRTKRYCCQILKEHGGDGRYVVTGVRWAESGRRKNSRGVYETMTSNKKDKVILTNDNDPKRKFLENCITRGKYIINPIIDWTDEQVWDFIKGNNLEYCKLYDEGQKRLGCVYCPMSNFKNYDEQRYAVYKRAYIRSFDKMLANIDSILDNWKTGADVFEWWGQQNKKEIEIDENQIEFELELEE